MPNWRSWASPACRTSPPWRAITFDDVVVFHDPLTPQLIFHEMVHVVQYRLLGIDEFARLYVRGYLHGGY